MNKDLHDIDKLFLEALEKNAQQPSISVKEKLIAALDKKDAQYNRRRFIWWRNMALVLLMFFAGYILFDSLTEKSAGGLKELTTERTASDAEADPGTNKIIPAEKNPADHYFKTATGEYNKKEPSIFPAPFTGSTSLVYFNAVPGSSSKKEGPAFLPHSTFPESFSERLGFEISKPLLSPFSLSGGYTKKNLSQETQLLPSVPFFSLKKSPGKNFRPYWQFTFFTSYDQVGYLLDSDDPVAISNIKHNEVHEPSFSGGILAARQFSKHWGLQTGLTYSNTVIGISPQKIYAFQDANGNIAFKYITSSGYAYIKPSFGQPPSSGDSLTAESKHRLHTLHIPLMATYTTGKNKLTITPAAGIDAGFVTSARSEIELTDASNHEKVFINKLSGTKKIYVSAAVLVDLQYKLGNKTSFSLQPVYRHALSPITENNVVETFPRSLGIRAGLTIKF